MWILENEGEALSHKRLWLRPGKRYLFGRTVAEPGQLAIQGPLSERVSRKHVTISVAAVEEGHADILRSRSVVTIEDLGSKGGTKVNGHKYRSETCILTQDSNTLQMGSFPPLFRITWFPVVLSFSFTSNQLRANPFSRLRDRLEQLDIKLLSEYDVQLTTHVVSRKRNTSKGLQALINGKYIVNDGFVDAITNVASPEAGDANACCPLEQDFDANWPDPLRFLPPPGEEPVPRPAESFAPNPERAQLFDGYTFIFYEKKQYQSLLAPITNGKGKALLNEVTAGETQIDDFLRFVKGAAGEKGLGEFEDGSEGKGVVVVKWMPSSSENADWYAEFFTSISLRLDHRLIDQKDFLEAILNNDASMLRRPLEFASQPGATENQASTEQQPAVAETTEEPVAQPTQLATRRRGRGPIRPRFQGFAISLGGDDGPEEAPSVAMKTDEPLQTNIESSEEGLFVSQNRSEFEPEDNSAATRQLQRKRPASPLPEPGDIMDDFAPTAAQIKRRRIAAGEEPVPRRKTPAPVVSEPEVKPKASPKVKKEIDVLEVARQNLEEAERRAKKEREELEEALGDLDLTEIRRKHIVETISLREAPPVRTREQDIADGRWDPAWNGRKNFKKFRQRGATQGRRPEKIIVMLEEAKTKNFGIGDDYWLEDNESQQLPGRQDSRVQSRSQSRVPESIQPAPSRKRVEKVVEHLVPSDSSDEEERNGGLQNDAEEEKEQERGGEEEEEEVEEDDDDDDDDIVIPSSSRAGRTRSLANTTQSQRRTQRSTNTQQSSLVTSRPARRTGKRPAATPPAKEKPAKRPKAASVAPSDDDSDDEIRFRFAKR
ncbi:hypothetical protein F5Y17DRAFT_103566 [Xylariaceae sp. FL0594]|nr:hypothetical protein F5Y17DRAFT_103566 [Xylariaceae sp. FL0594]